MKTDIYLKSRNDSFDASGTFDNGKTIVKKGSRIRLSFADHVRGGTTAKRLRENPTIVSPSGVVLEDCTFNSPSTAAQFVMGSSVNGWRAWHVDKKTSLEKAIK